MRLIADWLNSFPELKENSDLAWRSLAAKAMRMQVKRGSVLFRDGDACNAYVLVISGSVRVQKIDPQGHEIVLYRVEEGQSCMLTTTCLLGNHHYPAEGVAETDVDIVSLPLGVFHEALSKSPQFMRFVMANIGNRISELMLLLEDVAFGRKDVRLAAFLLKHAAKRGNIVEMTHRQLAVELGTAREVVSRLIKDFERKGLVNLGRNRITILQLDLIRDIANRDRD
ncbi:MAG: Crp/Fnr family transcriptional regulator [Mariprofundus sp.]|nr:Crp/Fnr family transcriptional regulator [Mariprofundus sp.]